MTQIGGTEDARRYRKLHFGVQILLNEGVDVAEGWYHAMRYPSYGQKLDLLGGCALFGLDGFPAGFTARGVVFTDLLGEVAA